MSYDERNYTSNNGPGVTDSVQGALNAANNARDLGNSIKNFQNAKTAANAANAGKAAKAGADAAKAASTAAKAGTAAAAGAATAGVGTIVVAVADKLLSGIKAFSDATGVLDGNTEGKSSVIGAIIGVFVSFFLIIAVFLQYIPTALYNTTLGTYTMEFLNFQQMNLKDKISYISVIANIGDGEKKELFDEIAEEAGIETGYSYFYNSQVSLDSTNFYIYKKIIDKATVNAFKIYCKELVMDPERWLEGVFTKYNKEEAEKYFLSLPYPYCLKYGSGQYDYWTIEDAINGDIPKEQLNNDLNYLEFITVLCQNQDINENFSFSDFYDLLMSKRISQYLYEIKVYEDKPVYYEITEDEETGEKIAERVQVTLDADLSKYEFFYEMDIRPYGLRELYAVANVDYYGISSDSTYQRNYEALEESEKWAYSYLEELVSAYPSALKERTVATVYYSDIKNRLNKTPTGRSPWVYLTSTSLDDRFENDRLEIWDEIDYPNPDIFYTPSGESVIIDIPSYINQGNYPNSPRGNGYHSPRRSDCEKCNNNIIHTIKNYGCIDCSYTMLMQYYTKENYNIKDVSTTYVTDQSFQISTFLADNNATGEYGCSFSKSDIVSQITEGKPVIMYLKGQWRYANQTYHHSDNGHYILIMGYDEKGFYVYDPASKANTEGGAIPYEAFRYANYKALYFVTYNGSWKPKYMANTILEGATNESN